MSTTRKYTVESADSRDVVYGDDAVLDGTVLKIHRGGKLVGLFRDWRTVIAEDDQVARVLDALPAEVRTLSPQEAEDLERLVAEEDHQRAVSITVDSSTLGEVGWIGGDQR